MYEVLITPDLQVPPSICRGAVIGFPSDPFASIIRSFNTILSNFQSIQQMLSGARNSQLISIYEFELISVFPSSECRA